MTPGTASNVSRRAFIGSIFLALGIGALPSRIAGAQATRQYTFAVLGTDKRTSEAPENTDTMMVSRVDMGAGTVRTLSIPRNLYVEIHGHGFDKSMPRSTMRSKPIPNSVGISTLVPR